jgi:hypothetical protein
MAEQGNPLKTDDPASDSLESLLNTIANKLADAIEDEDWGEVMRVEELCRKGLPNG